MNCRCATRSRCSPWLGRKDFDIPGARTVLSAATHAKPRGRRQPTSTRARGAWPFGRLLPLRALLRVETRAPSLRPIPARGQSCPQQRTKTKQAPETPPARADARLAFRRLLPFGRCCGLKPALRYCGQSRRADSLVRSNARKPRGARHATSTRATRLGLSDASCPFGRCCGLKPALRYCGQSRRADSLVRSNARTTKRRPTTHAARADAPWPFGTPLALRALLRVETRAPLFRPIPARGQSCPQQRTQNQEATAKPPARADARLAFRAPACLFGRCCGLKPALRHCGQSRRADSLVRSNARTPSRRPKAHQHARTRAWPFGRRLAPSGVAAG